MLIYFYFRNRNKMKDCDKIHKRYGKFKKIKACKADIKDLKAEKANIENLKAQEANINNLIGNNSYFGNLSFTNISGQNGLINNISGSNLTYTNISGTNATFTNVCVTNLSVTNLTITYPFSFNKYLLVSNTTTTYSITTNIINFPTYYNITSETNPPNLISFTNFISSYDGVRIYIYNNVSGNNNIDANVSFTSNDIFIDADGTPSNLYEVKNLQKHHYTSLFGEWQGTFMQFYEMQSTQ